MVLLYFCNHCYSPIDLTRLRGYIATRPHFNCAECHGKNETTDELKEALAEKI